MRRVNAIKSFFSFLIWRETLKLTRKIIDLMWLILLNGRKITQQRNPTIIISYNCFTAAKAVSLVVATLFMMSNEK